MSIFLSKHLIEPKLIMFIIGLILGIVFAFISMLLPGMTVGISFMLISVPGVSAEFSLGFLIGSDSIAGILKQISVLNPVGRSDEVYTNQATVSFNKEQAKKAAFNAVMAYSLIKIVALGIGALAFATGLAANLNFGLYFAPLGIFVFFLMWGKLIFGSKNKVSTLLIVLAGIFLGWLVSKSATNSMLVLSSALLAIPSSIGMISFKSKKEEDEPKYVGKSKEIDSDETLDFSAAFAGVISTLLMGLPTSALIQAFDNKENPSEKVIQSAVADGMSSGLGLVMVLASGSARSAMASNIAIAMPTFNVLSALGILMLVMILTFAMYQIAPLLIKALSSKGFSARLAGIFSLGCTVALVIVLGGWVGVGLIAVGLVLQQSIKHSDSPSCVSLSCLSIPIISMLGL